MQNGYDALHAEAAALARDEADRAELAAVNEMMEELRSPLVTSSSSD